MVHYIYRFWVGEDLLYIGETQNMEQRMFAHFCNSSRTCSLRPEQYKEVTKVDYMEIPNHADGKMFEIYCINTIRSEANQRDCFDDSPIPNPVYDSWQEWEIYDEGDVQQNIVEYKESCMELNRQRIKEFEKTNKALVFFTDEIGITNRKMKQIIDGLGDHFREQFIYGCPWNKTQYITEMGQQIIQDEINK